MISNDPVTRLVRLPEIIRIIGVSRPTVYRLIERGEFPKPIKQGRTSAWPSEEVDAYMAKIKDERH